MQVEKIFGLCVKHVSIWDDSTVRDKLWEGSGNGAPACILWKTLEKASWGLQYY